MGSKFGIQSQAVISVWIGLPHVVMVRTFPSMTLAVEWDDKTLTLTSFVDLSLSYWSVGTKTTWFYFPAILYPGIHGDCKFGQLCNIYLGKSLAS